MSARTKARKRALDVLYGSELRGLPLDGLLDGVIDEAAAPRDYTRFLVRGVVEHQPRLDAALEQHSVGWSLARMPAVDRNLLRIGCFEVLLVDDVPNEVAISEAVHLAGELSTDESPAFVNGLLARIAELKPSPTRDR